MTDGPRIEALENALKAAIDYLEESGDFYDNLADHPGDFDMDWVHQELTDLLDNLKEVLDS